MLARPRCAGDTLRVTLQNVHVERWPRNFLSMWPSLLAVSIGLNGVIPALPLYIEDRFRLTDPNEVEGWTAAVYGAAPLAAAVCGPFWGALGDRVGRKAMVVRAHAGMAAALVLMPFADAPFWLAALRVMQGVFAGFIAPAFALVTADVAPDRQGRVIAQLQLALALGLALGPIVGAEAAAWWGRAAVFQVGAALAALSLVPIALCVREDRSRLTSRAPPAVPIRAILTDRALLCLLLLIFLLRFAVQMVEPFTALWVRELGPLHWLAPDGAAPERALDRTTALAFTILAIGQIVVTTAWGRWADRFGPLRCLVLASLVLGVLLGATSLVSNVGQYLALRGGQALFISGLLTLAHASAGKRVDAARKGLAFGMVQSCIHLGLALGPMFGSVVSRDLGLRGLFAVSGACAGIAGLAMLWLRRATRGRVRDPVL